MAAQRKINGLSKSITFQKSSNVILSHRFSIVKTRIKRFIKESNQDNLHALRIAIRRLRYSLENYEICFKKKEFVDIYNKIRNLQDLTGECRDLDVIREKVEYVCTQNLINVPDEFYLNLSEQKRDVLIKIDAELEKFLKEKEVKDFFSKS